MAFMLFCQNGCANEATVVNNQDAGPSFAEKQKQYTVMNEIYSIL